MPHAAWPIEETVLSAPCKINLYLRILGRRADGYHDLETLFFPLPEPADELVIRRFEGGGPTLRVPSDPFRPTISLPGQPGYAEKTVLAALDNLLDKRIPPIRPRGPAPTQRAFWATSTTALPAPGAENSPPSVPPRATFRFSCRLSGPGPGIGDVLSPAR
jgi:hypothetical protein